MSRRDFIGGGFEIEDVNGSFDRFIRQAPKELKKRMHVPVLGTAFALSKRMAANAPVGPDAPHLAEAVTFKHTGLTAQVGYLAEHFGGDPARDDDPEIWKSMLVTNAWVALFNEYNPNNHPFMRPSAEAEAPEYVKRVYEAIASMERALSRGL